MTHYSYDAFGNTVRITRSAVAQKEGTLSPPISESYSYDALGRQIEITDAKGFCTKKCYNAYGKPTRILYPDGSEETFTYYLNGQCKSHTDPEGMTIFYEYDVLSREVKRCYLGKNNECLAQQVNRYNSFHLIESTDKEGNSTHFSYDCHGRKIKEQKAEQQIEFTYDALGRVQQQKRAEQIHITQKDLLNRLIEEKIEDSTGNVLFQAAYTYHPNHLKASTTKWIQNQPSTERFEYDSFERLKKHTDPLGHITQYQYDEKHANPFGQTVLQKTTIDPLQRKTIETFDVYGQIASLKKVDAQERLLFQEDYFYDAAHQLIERTAQLLHEPAATQTCTIELKYDCMNRKTELIEANGKKITRYRYTTGGKIAQITKPDQTIIEYDYDALGFLERLTSSDKTIDYTYQYNRNGALISAQDHVHGLHSNLERDSHGQITQETLMNGLTLKNAYDPLGRRVKLSLPDDSPVYYNFDALNLRAVRYEEHEWHYQFDTGGALVKEILPNTLGTIEYQLDLKGRPLQSHSPYFQEELTFDPCGNLLAHLLDKEKRTYTYNALDQLIQEEGPFYHTFSCDALSNRRSKDARDYLFDEESQLTLAENTQFIYDPNGNLIEEHHPEYKRHFTYDALDRLIEIIQDNSLKLTFVYDQQHRRLSKTRYKWSRNQWKIEETRSYFYDGQNEIGATDSDKTIKELRILGWTPHAERRGSVLLKIDGYTYIPIHDLQGNLFKLLYRGRIYETYSMDAFGEESEGSSPISPWRFSSKRIDAETQLCYFGQRYYNPGIGRFITPDPAGFTDSLNLYAYVGHNPNRFLDHYGLFIVDSDPHPPPRRLSAQQSEPDSSNEAIRTTIEGIGKSLQKVFTWNTSTLFETGGKELPDRRIFFVNGINYTPQESPFTAKTISSGYLDGYNIRGIYNPSYGMIGDLILSAYDLVFGGTKIPTIKNLDHSVQEALSEGVKNICIIATSEGCVVTKNYLANQPREVRNAISVLAISPAAYINEEYCRSMAHYCSARDFVPYIDRLIHPINYLESKHTINILSPHSDAPLLDHTILSPTFKNSIKEHGINFINTGKIR